MNFLIPVRPQLQLLLFVAVSVTADERKCVASTSIESRMARQPGRGLEKRPTDQGSISISQDGKNEVGGRFGLHEEEFGGYARAPSGARPDMSISVPLFLKKKP